MRAVGSTHSWSPLYPDEGNILLDGTGLNKILEVHSDSKKEYVPIKFNGGKYR